MKTGFIFLGIMLSYLNQLLASSINTDNLDSLSPKTSVLLSAKQNSMNIDPKHRASDYKDTFEYLRKEKAQNKVFVKLLDGSLVTNIIEMSLMPNNTVFLLRYNTPKGIKVQAVELELIHSIGYLE